MHNIFFNNTVYNIKYPPQNKFKNILKIKIKCILIHACKYTKTQKYIIDRIIINNNS